MSKKEIISHVLWIASVLAFMLVDGKAALALIVYEVYRDYDNRLEKEKADDQKDHLPRL